MGNTQVGEWLERQFLAWQSRVGERQTLDAFAQYVGISRSTLNKWMNGTRIPDDDHVDLLADKFGDEIYELLGLSKRDKRLRKIITDWETYSEEKREEIYSRAENGSTSKTSDKVVAHPKRKQKT